jgi:hypothetical protein
MFYTYIFCRSTNSVVQHSDMKLVRKYITHKKKQHDTIQLNSVKFTFSRISTVHKLKITIQYKLQTEIIYQVIYLY